MIWAYLQAQAIGRFHLFLKLRNWGRTVLFLQAYLQRMELLLLCTQVAAQASQRFVRCCSFSHFASLIETQCMVNLANRPHCKEDESEDHSLVAYVQTENRLESSILCFKTQIIMKLQVQVVCKNAKA